MAATVERLGSAVKHKDSIEINWEFKTDWSELTANKVTFDTPGPLPVPGSWELELCRDSRDPDTFHLSFQHGSLPIGAFGKSVVVKVRLATVDGAEKRLLHENSWNDGAEPSLQPTSYTSYGSYWLTSSQSKLAANGRWTTSQQNSVQHYCATLVLERDLQADTARRRHFDRRCIQSSALSRQVFFTTILFCPDSIPC